MENTAVEWLYNKFSTCTSDEMVGNINNWFEQAKVIENKQREELYNETEVLQLLIKLKQTESFDNLYEWFEKNKKIRYETRNIRR